MNPYNNINSDQAKANAAALISNMNNTSTIDTLLEKERDA